MAIIPTSVGAPQGANIAIETALGVAGSASRTDLQTVLTTNDTIFGNLLEDRSAKYVGGGTITLSSNGQTLTFSDQLDFTYNKGGTYTTVSSIVAAAGTLSFTSNNTVAYITLNRTAGTASLTSNASSLPAATTSQEIFLLAQRRDDLSPATQRVYLYSGQSLTSSQTLSPGSASGLTTSYQATSFNAVANFSYLVNTTSGAITATLPSGTTGAVIQFNDDSATWATHNLTIAPAAAQTIQGISSSGSLIANLSGATIQLSWDSTNSYWVVSSSGFQYNPVATTTNQGTIQLIAPTQQRFPGGTSGLGNQLSGTYTLPTSPSTPLWIRVRMMSGGGSGAGGGTSGAAAGGGGSLSSFGSVISITGGAAGGAGGSGGGAGGVVTLTGITGITVNGGSGSGGNTNSTINTSEPGGMGGQSAMGGGGGAGTGGNAGLIGAQNSGGGGGGGGASASASATAGGSGGGAGGFVDVIITSPSATYAYLIGGGGTAGTGTGGGNGGGGGSGFLLVEEHYY